MADADEQQNDEKQQDDQAPAEKPAPKAKAKAKAKPVPTGSFVEVEGYDDPQRVRFRRDLGRVVLQDGTTHKDADVKVVKA